MVCGEEWGSGLVWWDIFCKRVQFGERFGESDLDLGVWKSVWKTHKAVGFCWWEWALKSRRGD